jgi:hypothetical protein
MVIAVDRGRNPSALEFANPAPNAVQHEVARADRAESGITVDRVAVTRPRRHFQSIRRWPERPRRPLRRRPGKRRLEGSVPCGPCWVRRGNEAIPQRSRGFSPGQTPGLSPYAEIAWRVPGCEVSSGPTPAPSSSGSSRMARFGTTPPRSPPACGRPMEPSCRGGLSTNRNGAPKPPQVLADLAAPTRPPGSASGRVDPDRECEIRRLVVTPGGARHGPADRCPDHAAASTHRASRRMGMPNPACVDPGAESSGARHFLGAPVLAGRLDHLPAGVAWSSPRPCPREFVRSSTQRRRRGMPMPSNGTRAHVQ